MNQAIVNIKQIMNQAIEQIADKTGGDKNSLYSKPTLEKVKELETWISTSRISQMFTQNHIWLVVFHHPSEKYEFVSWHDDIPNIWNNEKMFQTTNQTFSHQKISNVCSRQFDTI